MVKIQADAPTAEPSKRWAFRHTASNVSWARSSALASSSPDRRMKVFTRGAKYANNCENAARSRRVAIASIKTAQCPNSTGAALSGSVITRLQTKLGTPRGAAGPGDLFGHRTTAFIQVRTTGITF